MQGESGLFMNRLRLDTRRLFELGRRHRLPPNQTDLGYLVHCALMGLFGDDAPRPFHVEGGDGRVCVVLAYGRSTKANLLERARRFADPGVFEALDWESLAQKPMPEAWQAGTRFDYRVRVCPVVRMNAEDARHRKGAEVDVFLARCWEAGESTPVDRGEVYGRWLGEQLRKRGGAEVVTARLDVFRRERLVRKSGGPERRPHVSERPDATLEGTLAITDGAAFAETLASGVGRHRSFGFGMLLLTPAGSAKC